MLPGGFWLVHKVHLVSCPSLRALTWDLSGVGRGHIFLTVSSIFCISWLHFPLSQNQGAVWLAGDPLCQQAHRSLWIYPVVSLGQLSRRSVWCEKDNACIIPLSKCIHHPQRCSSSYCPTQVAFWSHRPDLLILDYTSSPTDPSGQNKQNTRLLPVLKEYVLFSELYYNLPKIRNNCSSVEHWLHKVMIHLNNKMPRVNYTRSHGRK